LFQWEASGTKVPLLELHYHYTHYSFILRAEITDNAVSNGVYLVLTVTYKSKIIKRIRHEKEKSCNIRP